MEQNKYYTPLIEDIKVGYECEMCEVATILEKWVNVIINKNLLSLICSYNKDYTKIIRTPFLTKEQIEAEGWKPLEDKSPFTGKPYKWKKIIGEKETGMFNQDHIYTIEYYQSNATPQLTIHLKWESSWNRYNGTIYVGKCPSINEFRYICKLLGI